MQHPTSDNCGKERSVNVIDENIAKLRRVQDLPDNYTSVQPVVLKNSNPVVPKLKGPVMPLLDDNVSSLPKELDWLNNVKSLCGKNELSHEDFMSWAASHASLPSSPVQQVDIVALLPLYLEISHSSAMIRHGMNVVNDVVQHLNPGQTPVIAMDQPLFAFAKLIQWNMPETQGEDRSVQNIKKIGIMCILCTPRPMYRLIYRPTLDRCIGRHIDRYSTDMSVDIPIDTRPIYRPRYVGRYVGRYIDRYIGRYVGRHIDRECLSDSRPTCRSIGYRHCADTSLILAY